MFFSFVTNPLKTEISKKVQKPGYISYPRELEKNEEITILSTGDVMLGRKVTIESLEKNDPIYPFRLVGGLLREADLVFINLENPIIKDCPKSEVGFKFCAPSEMVAGLTYAGIDVASLANNHSQNFGKEGLDETIKFLESKGILVTGVGKLVIKEVNGTTFGFLGYDKAQQGNPKLEDGEIALIKNSDSLVDVLIVGMHWGVEYQDKALPGVRSFAHDLVKNGADVIIGHHPHWVQDVDCFKEVTGANLNTPDLPENAAHYALQAGGWYRFTPLGNSCPAGSKPVYYSLGNFIFDQMWSEETRQGAVAKLTFKGGKLIEHELLKIYMTNWAQPEFVDK
ncbi:MAG: SH3 type 3 domain protein [Microgenomates group bacterium GW2011_GWC1_38_12]|nr:MAG: SH3 type 3 domain protein [Microgenomates group bacterium GW2011_GWC1_38_12]